MLKKIITKDNLFILILFSISSFYLLNLAGQGYSLDETETVTVARSIFKFGIPSAWDGVNLTSGSNGLDSVKFNDIYVWKWHPWLQYYITAAGISIAGDNPAGSRMFFALFGIFTIIVTYLTARELFKNKFISFIIALQLILLLPFFLYVRNVRYYSPSAFLSIVILLILIRYIKGKWNNFSLFLLTLSTSLLFFTNYIIWASTILTITVLLIFRRNKGIFWMLIAELFFATLWYIFFKPYGGNIFITSEGLFLLFSNILKYLSYINSYLFALILTPFLLFLAKRNFYLIFILIFITIKILIYSFFLYPHGRYLIDLYPVFILTYGFIYAYFIKKKLVLMSIIIFIILSTTNIIHVSLLTPINPDKYRLHFWPAYYAIELNHRYETVMPKVGKYIQQRYSPGDLFWSNRLSYNYTKVPSISPICNTNTGYFEGPEAVTNPEKIRWFIFFNQAQMYSKNLSDYPCFDKTWDTKLKNDYKKIFFTYPEDTYALNDVDIFNRQFPPPKINQNEVIIYEKL